MYISTHTHKLCIQYNKICLMHLASIKGIPIWPLLVGYFPFQKRYPLYSNTTIIQIQFLLHTIPYSEHYTVLGLMKDKKNSCSL